MADATAAIAASLFKTLHATVTLSPRDRERAGHARIVLRAWFRVSSSRTSRASCARPGVHSYGQTCMPPSIRRRRFAVAAARSAPRARYRR